MKHHDFSPSKLQRLACCPWSYQNCLNWHDEGSSDAERGSMLHAAIYDDTVYDKLDERDRGMIDFIREEHIKPYADEKKFRHYAELPVQIRLGDCVLTEGTLDDLVITADGKTASLKDWKFGGYEVPPASENLQLQAYACGVFEAFPSVEKVFAMVVQPVFGTADYDKQTVFTRAQCDAMVQTIADVINRAKNASEIDAFPSAGNCRYCNKFACKAYREKMEQNFELLSINLEQLDEQDEKMTVEFADRLLLAKKEIESIMEEKTESAKKCIIDAGGSENFRIQQGRVTKRTNWKAVVEKFDIPQSAINEETTESVGASYLVPRMRRKKIENI